MLEETDEVKDNENCVGTDCYKISVLKNCISMMHLQTPVANAVDAPIPGGVPMLLI